MEHDRTLEPQQAPLADGVADTAVEPRNGNADHGAQQPHTAMNPHEATAPAAVADTPSSSPPAANAQPGASLPGSFDAERPTSPPLPPLPSDGDKAPDVPAAAAVDSSAGVDVAVTTTMTMAAATTAAPAAAPTVSSRTNTDTANDAAAGADHTKATVTASVSDPSILPSGTASPVRRPIYKRRSVSQPKGILKPAPPPQKGFSFKRDILQNINTRLAQQGVNVQVPVPQGGTAQATASYLGGVLRKISGLAAGAAANVSGPGTGGAGGYLAQDQHQSARSPHEPSLYGSLQRQGTSSSMGSIDGGSSSSLSIRSTTSTSSDTTLSAAPLKKVQFQVSQMTVTYPIVGSGTPEDEDLTRIRIEREHRKMLRVRKGRKWTPEELESLYRDCCRTREEHPLKKMRLVFQEAAQAVPPGLRTMDLSFVPLDRQAVEPIADLLSVDFGLTKLVLENCSLTDASLKSILHALLVSGTLPNLSLASNRKIRFHGWKYVAIFMRRAQALRYLDLSENSINKASLEHILQAITKPADAVTRSSRDKNGAAKADAAKLAEASALAPAAHDEAADELDEEGEPLMPTAPLLRNVSDEAEPPASAVISLRLENCGLKTAALEMLARAVRHSEIRHLSLRRNGIIQLGAVALAVLLKDYPDSVATLAVADRAPNGSAGESNGSAPLLPPHPRAGPGGDGVGGRAAYPARQGRPREVDRSQSYDRRQRSYSPSLPDVPVVVSSPAGGITNRRMPAAALQPSGASQAWSTSQTPDGLGASPLTSPIREMGARLTDAERAAARRNAPLHQNEEEAIALFQAKRAKRLLADLPRVGNLLTLDLKSNDIRGGVAYLAQALKKNRTLRVLNLSDNQIEMPGLVAIAEALKYNSTLETLDMSHNPCSGPGLEGITTLRTAFTLNSNLKRLFLNGTDLSSEGAIALAEFLPEAKSLIHLDLAENFDIDIAGVMALAVSVRMNKSLRCLDLNIPPNNPDFARLSQEILQSCIRNTELAQQKATQKGLKQPIAAPIYKSVVARAAREQDERLKAIQAARAAEEQAALAAAGDKRKATDDLLAAAQECRNVLRDLLEGEEKRQREAPEQKVAPPGDFVEDLTKQSKSLQRRLGNLATSAEEGNVLERCLALHDELNEVTTRLERFYRYGAAPLGDPRSEEAAVLGASASSRHDLLAPPGGGDDANLSSPAFSIADSDDSDDGSDDEAGPSRRRSNGRHEGDADAAAASGAAGEGLGIDSNSGPVADREEPDEEDKADEKRHQQSPSGLRAKGQLSEEGELFRKAKSLGLDAEGDESSGDADTFDDAASSEAEHDGAWPSHAAAAHKARRGSSSSLGSTAGGRKGSGSAYVEAGLGLVEGTGEVKSGEELRKDLLHVDLPPKPQRRVSVDADEAGEATAGSHI
ncbi:hypothetical protein ACQY0O_000725 [Thecaphora frezii]